MRRQASLLVEWAVADQRSTVIYHCWLCDVTWQMWAVITKRGSRLRVQRRLRPTWWTASCRQGRNAPGFPEKGLCLSPFPFLRPKRSKYPGFSLPLYDTPWPWWVQQTELKSLLHRIAAAYFTVRPCAHEELHPKPHWGPCFSDSVSWECLPRWRYRMATCNDMSLSAWDRMLGRTSTRTCPL